MIPTTWKLFGAGNIVTRCIGENSFESQSVDTPEIQDWLAQGNTPLPADPVPNPAIAAIDAQLAAIDLKSIRPGREGEPALLATLTAQAIKLRAARALLPEKI